MPVSSNSLFHFTNSADHLFNILKNDFIPHFSLETFYATNGFQHYAVPMVSFCDIPLSQVKDHLNVYGNYGIGLSKQWAKSKKLNPVLYLIKDSYLDNNIFTTFSIYNTHRATLDPKVINSIAETLKNLKMYEGIFERSTEPKKTYCFYNEREWRYSPPGSRVIEEAEFRNSVARNRHNLEIENEKLTFSPDDITYVIIKDESEIDSMIKAIPDIKNKKYRPEQVQKLISRIITVEQIKNDF